MELWFDSNKYCPCLKWYTDPSSIFGNVPKLDRLHFFTPAFLGVGSNLVFVSIFFNDLGCLWLLSSLSLYSILFILGSLYSIGSFSLIVLNAYMFLGLYVETYGNVMSLGLLLYLVFLSSSVVMDLALFMPSFIIWIG